jgi:hypothetical protein
MDALWHNSLHLVSKPDIRATLLFLADWQNGVEFERSVEPYLDSAVIFFTEKVRPARTCADIGILPWYCSCMVMQDLPAKTWKTPLESSAPAE